MGRCQLIYRQRIQVTNCVCDRCGNEWRARNGRKLVGKCYRCGSRKWNEGGGRRSVEGRKLGKAVIPGAQIVRGSVEEGQGIAGGGDSREHTGQE
jgi:hypothetical protein